MEKKFELIRNKIRQDSTLFSDRQRLKNLLSDCFQSQPLYINLLIMAYDENLSGCLKKFEVLTEPLLKKFRERLIKHNGIRADNADWAVIAWFKIFNRQIKLETQPVEPQTSRRTPRPISTTPTVGQPQISVPDFGVSSSNVPATTQSNKLTKKNKNHSSSKMDLLKRVFRQNFGSIPQWAFWNVDDVRWVFSGGHKDICEQMPNDSELRQIALNVICHGKYSERDIIHLRMNQQCTFGFAITYDSFCTGDSDEYFGLGNNIIKYSDMISGQKTLMDITMYTSQQFGNEIPLGKRLENFLNAAIKIINPNGHTGNNNSVDYMLILDDIVGSDGNNKGGYYHDGSWWTM